MCSPTPWYLIFASVMFDLLKDHSSLRTMIPNKKGARHHLSDTLLLKRLRSKESMLQIYKSPYFLDRDIIWVENISLFAVPDHLIRYTVFLLYRPNFNRIIAFRQVHAIPDECGIIVRPLPADAFAVYEQFQLLQVWKYHYIGHFCIAVTMAAVSDIDELVVFVPVCFVIVESILFHLTVESNQSFVVDPRTVAFCAVSLAPKCSNRFQINEPRQTWASAICFPVTHVIERSGSSPDATSRKQRPA